MSGSSTVLGSVRDAFSPRALAVREEDVRLHTYRFLPWVRSGIGASLATPFSTALPARAELSVSVPILDAGNAQALDEQGQALAPAQVALKVLGPGDVVGIDARQIIRTFPVVDCDGADPGRFCAVEFDRPDFPWLFTPAAPDASRLPPWLTLVCVEEQSSTLSDRQPLPTLTTPARELQPLAASFAWAHAQVLGDRLDGTDPPLADRLTSAYATLNLSRLICPRRLEANKRYLAALVPTFAAGRLAGLGLPIPADQKLDWAWDGSEDPVTLPVYFSFRFSTGERGDFEDLAELLDPMVAPWQVGRRPMDASQPGGGLPSIGPSESGAVVLMEGALAAIENPPDELDQPWPQAAVSGLSSFLNTPDDLAQGGAVADGLPLTVAPPLYGCWHAARRRVPSGDRKWFDELNLDIRQRVVAGLGTRVVQALQEPLMAEAWRQVGELERENQQLRQAQMARFAGQALHRRIAGLSADRLLGVTQPVHAKLRVAGGSTVAARLEATGLPQSALTASLRRLTSPAAAPGRVARRTGATEALTRLAVTSDGRTRSYVRTYRNPDGIDSASGASVALVSVRAGVAATAVRADMARTAATTPVHQLLSDSALSSVPFAASYDSTLVALALHTDLARDVVRQAAPGTLPVIPAVVRANARALRPLIAGRAVELEPARLAALLDLPPPIAQRLGQNLRAHAHAVLGPKLPRFRDVQVSGGNVRSMLGLVGSRLVGALSPPVAASRTDLPVASLDLIQELDSKRTVTARIKARAGALPAWLAPDWFDDGLVDPVMASPKFRRAVYADLRDLGQEYLVAGLDRVPPNKVTLLQTNPRFVEAFLVGLNHEFARELLWRGFPTDQRGTYFKHFWSTAHEDLDGPLHLLSPGGLGTHGGEDPARARVVLLVRGELLRRYPGTHIYAVRELEPAGGRRRLASDHVEPVVQGRLAPDATFVIFPLTVPDVKADPSWRFVLAENVTEPSFGFDELEGAAPGSKRRHAATAPIAPSDISWADVPFFPGTPFVDGGTVDFSPIARESYEPTRAAESLWGRDGAGMARVAFQLPVRVVLEAPAMIAKGGG
jgi:hypothetical protein